MQKQNGGPPIEPITKTAEWRKIMSPSHANMLGHTPSHCHKGTPKENENVLKLQNVLALVHYGYL